MFARLPAVHGSAGGGYIANTRKRAFEFPIPRSALVTCALNASTNARGVLAGATSPNHDDSLARPHIASGKVVALAKTGHPAKDALPGVPNLAASYPDADFIAWISIFASKRTPKEVVGKLNAEIAKGLGLMEIRTRLGNMDLTAAAGSPDDLDRTLRADYAVNRDLVKSVGLKVD